MRPLEVGDVAHGCTSQPRGMSSSSRVAARRAWRRSRRRRLRLRRARPSPGRAAILAACRDNLARYKVPARLVTLEAFPTTESPNGVKIQRGKLREMAERILREPAA